jgi:hypothetical protein
MDFIPPPATSSLQPGWDVEARTTHASIFAVSPDVLGFLAARAERTPLSPQDVQTLLALDSDLFYFDGTITSLDLGVRYGVEEHWTGYINLPLLYYSSGFLDSATEGFHESFGFSASGRDLVARDQYQVLIRHGANSFVLLNSQSGVYLGDPMLGVRYSAEFAPDWFAVAEGAVKLPVGEVGAYVSSGGIDYGAQLTLQKQFGRQAVYLSLSDVLLGDADQFPNSFREQVPEASVAYEFGATPHTAIILQSSWSKTAFETTTAVSSDEHLYSLGIRHRRGSFTYDFALTENLHNYDNTLDFALTFGVIWKLGA